MINLLKFDDPVKSALIKEEIVSNITILEDMQKEIIINQLIGIADESPNPSFIEKIIQIIDRILYYKGDNALNFVQILKKVKNQHTISVILRNIAHKNNELRDLIPFGLESDNLLIHNFTIEHIGKLQLTEFYDNLKEIFINCINILKNETNLFEITKEKLNNPENDFFIKSDEIRKISDKIQMPEIIEFNNELNILINQSLQNIPNNSFFAINKKSPYVIKKILIRNIIYKLNILIEQFIYTNQPFALNIIRELTNKMQISNITISDEKLKLDVIVKIIENKIEKNYSEITDTELNIKMRALLYKYLGHFGNLNDLDFLAYRFKVERSYEVRISIINAMKFIHDERNQIIEILKEIDKDDKFSFYAISNLIDIGGEEVERYLLNQLSLGNLRRIFLISFFVPVLKNVAFDKFAIELLNYKQPLFIRQGLWIIKKKKLTDAIPLIISLLFSENVEVKNDAIKTLKEFRSKSLPFLRKNINYYGDEKKTVLLDLIDSIENTIQKKIA